MNDFKFSMGQSVQLVTRAGPQMPPGPFSVVRAMPADGRGNQYRLKSLKDGHERVAAESELSALAG